MAMRVFLTLVLVCLPSLGWAQAFNTNSGSLSATGSVALNTRGFGTVGVQIAGTYSGTHSFEGTLDATNWVAAKCTQPSSTTAETTTTTTGAWACAAAGFRQFRVRMSAYTSGTATITLIATATGGGVGGGAVEVTSSALPTGAATADLQPVPGVAGTASADVITVQGIAGSTPVRSLLTDSGGTALDLATDSNTLKRYISVGTTEDESQVKATSGTLFGVSARNAHATTNAYLKCTNLTAANTTPGTSTVFYEILVPANGGVVDRNVNVAFSVALTCYIVTGKADNDVAEVAAGDVSYNLTYE